MTDVTNRSAEEIERDLKRKRSEIDRTAEAIQDRLSPEAAVEYALAYIRGSGGRRVLEAVQRNPLAAAIAVAAVGWLLLGLRQTPEDRRMDRPRRLRSQEPAPLPSMTGTSSDAPPL